jgi:hypothetical protein
MLIISEAPPIVKRFHYYLWGAFFILNVRNSWFKSKKNVINKKSERL